MDRIAAVQGTPRAQHEEDNELPYQPEFADVFTAPMVPQKWIIERLIPCGLTFIAGPPKSHKSSLAIAAAGRCAGAIVPGLPDRFALQNGGRVLYFAAEADAGEIGYTLRVGLYASIDPDVQGAFLCAHDPWAFRLDDRNGLRAMLAWLDERKSTLVVIDPLRDFHGAEENDSGEINRLLRPLQRWAKSNNAAVVIVHHTSKPPIGHKGPLTAENWRGTGALFAIADGAVTLTPLHGGDKVHVESRFKKSVPDSWVWNVDMLWQNKTEAAT